MEIKSTEACAKIGKNIKVIHIDVEQEGEDYYDCVVSVLTGLRDRLYGGYYEPYSERDVVLAEAISSIIPKS